MSDAKSKLSYMENTWDAVIDLTDETRPFPLPSLISLDIHREQGKPVDDDVEISDSRVIFKKITRDDIGSYSFSVTNYHLDDGSREVGTCASTFMMDVICKTVIHYCGMKIVIASMFHRWS